MQFIFIIAIQLIILFSNPNEIFLFYKCNKNNFLIATIFYQTNDNCQAIIYILSHSSIYCKSHHRKRKREREAHSSLAN